MHWMLLPYQRYLDFSGRSRRSEYCMFVLFYALVVVALNLLFGPQEWTRSSAVHGYWAPLVGGGSLIGILFAGISFVPAIAVAVRRLHDQDRSGWMVLLTLIPVVGGIVCLMLVGLEGTPGPNRFGPDPKAPSGLGVSS